MVSDKREIRLINDSVTETTKDYYSESEHGVTVEEILEGDTRRRTLYPWHRIANVVYGD